MRSFLGYATYYRKFIRGFATIAAPLNKLLQKGEDYSWNAECDQAFNMLKECFEHAVVLQYPDFNKSFLLDTDARDTGLGGVFSQMDSSNRERPLSFYSRSLSKAERRYSVTRKEPLALVDSVQHFRVYMYGRRFLVRTDNSALQWLQSFQEPRGQVARWIERLAEYDYEIVHRPGLKHKNADALSRYPVSAIAQEVWLPAYSKGELKKAQEADEGIRELLMWLRSATRPAPQHLQGKPFQTRY